MSERMPANAARNSTTASPSFPAGDALHPDSAEEIADKALLSADCQALASTGGCVTRAAAAETSRSADSARARQSFAGEVFADAEELLEDEDNGADAPERWV